MRQRWTGLHPLAVRACGLDLTASQWPKWRDLVNMVMNLRVHKRKERGVLTVREPLRASDCQVSKPRPAVSGHPRKAILTSFHHFNPRRSFLAARSVL